MGDGPDPLAQTIRCSCEKGSRKMRLTQSRRCLYQARKGICVLTEESCDTRVCSEANICMRRVRSGPTIGPEYDRTETRALLLTV